MGDRGPDRRPPLDDRYGSGRGQSYRGQRSPPYRGGYRPRSPPSRGYPPSDNYGPNRGGPPQRHRSRSPPYRPRSRSPPPFRGRDGDGMRSRPRSPSRRDYDGGYRGMSMRDPRDEPRYRDRSPPPMSRIGGERSPMVTKRSRDVSPVSSRGRFSPPPPKRERLASPARSRYSDHSGPRDRSPPRRQSPGRERWSSPSRYGRRSPPRRDDRMDPRAANDWRRRSPSPRRPDGRSGTDSGRESGPASRRPSPPLHPGRVLPPSNGPAGQLQAREQPRSPPRRAPSPHSRDRVVSGPQRVEANAPSSNQGPPSGPSIRSDHEPASQPSRVPPLGPKAAPSGPSSGPPSGPRAAAPAATLTAPRSEAGPAARGGRGGFSNSPYRGRGGYPSGGREYDTPTGPPSGPRGSGAPPGPYRAPSTPTVPTHPRSQRFSGPGGAPTGPASSAPSTGPVRKAAHPALASLPPILEEGKKLPDLVDRSTMDRLERQTEELRKVVDEKQAKKRRGLLEWERLENEVKLAELRAQLAQESLVAISGEEGGTAAF